MINTFRIERFCKDVNSKSEWREIQPTEMQCQLKANESLLQYIDKYKVDFLRELFNLEKGRKLLMDLTYAFYRFTGTGRK